MATSTGAKEIFLKYFGDLLTAIPHPELLACDLYSQKIITPEERDAVAHTNRTKKERTYNLLATMVSRIEVDPRAFDVFLSVLDKQPSMSDLLGRMRKGAYVKLSGTKIPVMDEGYSPCIGQGP